LESKKVGIDSVKAVAEKADEKKYIEMYEDLYHTYYERFLYDNKDLLEV